MATLTADTARWPLYLTTLEIGSAFVIDRFAERLESAMRSHPDLLYAGVDLYDPTAWGGRLWCATARRSRSMTLRRLLQT